MSNRQITEAIRQIAGTQLTDEVYYVPAEVVSVDLDDMTCVCQLVGGTSAPEIPNVRLMAAVADGLALVPAIDSTVLIVYSKREKPYVAMFSELQAIQCDVGNSSIDVLPALIKFNSGDFGGLVKVAELVSKLNALENAFNALNTKVNALAPTPVIPPVVPTQRLELENITVTHGS